MLNNLFYVNKYIIFVSKLIKKIVIKFKKVEVVMKEFISKDFKEAFINKSLEKHGVNFKDVKKRPLIDGVQWNDYYTLTEDEYKNWYHWCIKLLAKKYPDKSDNSLKTIFFDEYVIAYGLKQI